MNTETQHRLAARIATILNCRPDVRHPHYDLHLSDAIRVALNTANVALREPCATLEEVYDRLCALNPGHLWITGAAATELVGAVLTFAPTTYTARQGGMLLQLRGATESELKERQELAKDLLIEIDTDAVVPRSALDDVAMNHTFYLREEPIRLDKYPGLDFTSIHAALTSHSVVQPDSSGDWVDHHSGPPDRQMAQEYCGKCSGINGYHDERCADANEDHDESASVTMR